VIIVQTQRGRALLEDALDIVEDLEAVYAEHLGQARLASLKKSLSSLLDPIDPIGALGTRLSAPDQRELTSAVNNSAGERTRTSNRSPYQILS
jgi:hypothetical protein